MGWSEAHREYERGDTKPFDYSGGHDIESLEMDADEIVIARRNGKRRIYDESGDDGHRRQGGSNGHMRMRDITKRTGMGRTAMVGATIGVDDSFHRPCDPRRRAGDG